MSCSKKIICEDKLHPEEIISLMGIYREEWQYRDSAFMSSFLKFSLLSLFITFFPYLIDRVGMSSDSPLLETIHPLFFSIFGIICALFGLFYSCAEAKRIEKIDDAYKSLMKQLPEYARVKMLKDEIGNSKSIIKKFQLLHLNSVIYYAYLIPIGLAILNIVLILL